MELITDPLTKTKIENLQKTYGNYLKLTIDIKNGFVVAGCPLHADGEKVLLEKGSHNKDIWGGGIDLAGKVVDTTAVLNYRPNLGNTSMEILEPGRRKKFLKLVKKFFAELWK